MKGTAVQLTIVSDGFSRSFYGIKGIFRSLDGDTVLLADVNKSNEIATKADIAGIPREDVMADATRPLRVVEFFPLLQASERVDYVFVQEHDDSWTVLLHSGSVYIGNDRGETIDSFHAKKATRRNT